MNLPIVKKKKLINKKEFVKNARKAHKIFEEEARYLLERKMKYGDNLSSHNYPFS